MEFGKLALERLRLVWFLCIALGLTFSSANGDEWRVSIDKSAMDDSQSVYLMTDSVTTVPGSSDIGEVTPTLYIRCIENKTSLLVNWARYISTAGIYGDQPVRYRIDDKPPKKATWDISTNFEATGLWSGGASIPLIRQLINAKRFLIEVTPYGSNTIQAEFNVAGLEQRIGDVQKACGWSTVAAAGKSEAKKPADKVLDELSSDMAPGHATASQGASGQTATTTPSGLPNAIADEQYQYAFGLLRENRYDDAEKAFRSFISEHPDHQLAGNASYWLGETLYVRGDYKNAAITFAQGVKDYPQSGKAPDNMMKLGMALAAMDLAQDACNAFAEVGKRYPQASYNLKDRVSRERQRIGC